MSIRNFFWPSFKPLTATEQRRQDKLETTEVESIDAAKWTAAESIALEEAKRVGAEEDERVKTAESKASNFLLVIAALVPLIISLQTAIWDGKIGKAPKLLMLMTFVIPIVYLAGAGYWALRAISIGRFHRVGVSDLTRIWAGKGDKSIATAKAIMIATRRNQEPINLKVSAVAMTHSFMLRAIIALCTLFIIQGLWDFFVTTDFVSTLVAAMKTLCKWISTDLPALMTSKK